MVWLVGDIGAACRSPFDLAFLACTGRGTVVCGPARTSVGGRPRRTVVCLGELPMVIVADWKFLPCLVIHIAGRLPSAIGRD
jgi:hypothetical protein